MALQKEIWINSITEGLFADNTFAARSIDHSAFVSNKMVHVPQAGAGPAVVKNRATLPATVTTRTDTDLTYTINEFTTDPIRIDHADTVELSYDKRTSIMGVAKQTLAESVYIDILSSWIAGAGAITAGATISATVKSMKKQFDTDNVPATGRCIMLDADTYNQLLDELTDAKQVAFLAGADPIKGVVGRWMSFDFYSRSTLDGTQKGLAWWDQSVSRAMGNTEFFDDDKNPTYYGDILSFLIRAGGAPIRSDAKGLLTF